MFERILVPLDGSPLGEHALAIASCIAHTANAELVLVHASIDFDESMLLDAAELEVTTAREHIDKISAETYLGQIAEEVRADGIAVTTLVRPGPPGEVILNALRSQQPSLIVLASHCRGGLDRWLYGSVADQILRETTSPVLLVPLACDRSWPTDRPLRILVPLDGSRFAEEALSPARSLATQVNARLILVGVAQPPLVRYYPRVASLFGFEVMARLARARQYLDMTAGDPRRRGDSVTTRSRVGDPATEIVATAREQDVDLIIMATHGRGGLSRLMMGSVATEVVHGSRLPVMLIRPGSLRARPEEMSTMPDADTLATLSAR